MITNIELVNDKLIWTNDEKKIELFIPVGTYINDERNVLIMNPARNEVIAYDEKGAQVATISNTDSLYLMYLQKHPRFGLAIVSSIKEDDGSWKDKYIAFYEEKFEKISTAR